MDYFKRVILMTDNKEIIENFYEGLKLEGYKGKIVSAEHIPDLRRDIQKHREKNLLYPALYEDYKSYFEIDQEFEFPQVKSLFIISVPVPQFEAIFHWNNNEISLYFIVILWYNLKWNYSNYIKGASL